MNAHNKLAGMFGKAGQDKKADKKKKVKYTWQQNVALYLHDMIFMLVIVMAVLMLFLRVIVVDGPSMENTLLNGDYMLLVGNMFYKDPSYGDIVVVSKQAYDNGKPIVKRVIATAGQTVDIDFNLGQVYVDGELLDEDYINDYTYREEGTVFPLTVPEGEVFLMGDNRNHSNDSRDSSLGTVDTRLLIGKAVFLVFPGRDYLTEQREFGRIGLLQ